ncbi:MAG: hypothetical protein SGPRY_014177 [Prymnesium sp.]
MGSLSLLLAPNAALASGLADSSFVQASSLIFVSELGDKTFFIATLLAARASKLLTFAGGAGALAVMTVISVIIGQVFHPNPNHTRTLTLTLTLTLTPILTLHLVTTVMCVIIGQVFHAVPPSLTRGLPLDDYIAVVSFVFFGVKALVDALNIEEDGAGIEEERDEAEDILEQTGVAEKGGWPLVVEACTLTLAAEIGDRSQLATIALGAAGNPLGVCAGGILGHCAATGMAVLGGSFISKYLSERVIGVVGGVLFLVFALTTAIGLF